MGFLVGAATFSLVAAILVVRIFDYVKDWMFEEASNGFVNGARAGLFVTTWTAVTTRAGMDGLTKRVRRLKRGAAALEARLDALTKGDER